MQAYLFVHFRERTTPDGEQVYFGLSRDGFLARGWRLLRSLAAGRCCGRTTATRACAT